MDSTARTHSRRPFFFLYVNAAGTRKNFGSISEAPFNNNNAGRAKRIKVTILATGFPGRPINGVLPIWPKAIGLPGRMASRQKCIAPNLLIACRI